MHNRQKVCLAATLFVVFIVGMTSQMTLAEKREIEEIIVTAEKREATVSDTSISITAFSDEMVEDLGIQSADEMINYIPATTRDAYDIRIRGIGRNYRSLGGDPGVATYYNGVYSEDFGIAATENALYDLERIEVLRGPQGTLYGRNSIGGALNYITRQPTFDWTGELRTQIGNYNQRQYYGAISGPIVGDVLAMRVTGSKIFRDGDVDGQVGTEDINSVHDANVAIAFKWRPTSSIEANMRWNDRESSRRIGGTGFLIDEGRPGERGVRNTDIYHAELTPVAEGTPGAIAYTHPVTGEAIWGAYTRPGLDGNGCWPCLPRAAHHATGLALNSPDDLDDVERIAWTNGGNWEAFTHNAVSFDITWDITERTALKYIYGYWDQLYQYDIDYDKSSSDFSNFRYLDAESARGFSHELQLLWNIGDNLSLTSGAYMFFSHRNQNWGMVNDTAQGRIVNPVNYGYLEDWISGIYSNWAPHGSHPRLQEGTRFINRTGRWEGDPDGYYYHHNNKLDNTSYAIFTQAVYTFNDQWALTVGLRWAQDNKEALEDRGGYFEQVVGTGGFMDYIVSSLPAYGAYVGYEGLTYLGAVNYMMGNAIITYDASNPIIPTCALDDPDCATPLRLGGIPFGWQSETYGKHTWDDITYRVNVDWTPSDNTLLYFGATKGYRSGGYALGVADGRDVPRGADGIPTGVEGTDVSPPFSYDPETVVAWELGYKSMLLNNTLQFFASIYSYDYEGYQDENNIWDPIRMQGITVVTNTGQATNKGLEMELTWLPTDSLTIGSNYSYTIAEYDEDYFVVDDDDPNIVPSLVGAVADAPDLYSKNVKGNQIKRIPKNKGVIWGSYRINMASGTIDLQATWSYTGEYDNGYRGRDVDQVPSRTQTDVGILWTDTRDLWRVRAFADNVFDEKNLSAIGQGGEGSNWALSAGRLAPRMYGLNVIRKFN